MSMSIDSLNLLNYIIEKNNISVNFAINFDTLNKNRRSLK